jgi:hypothetical protein
MSMLVLERAHTCCVRVESRAVANPAGVVTMSLRQSLGPDADHIHEVLDRLLDSDDGLIVLIDGRRAISYAAGFGMSPCQLELLTERTERALRKLSGRTR